MIETAIRLSESKISAGKIAEILGLAREMLRAPVQLLDGVKDVLVELSQAYELMLITKGDLFDQEVKVAHSGLRPLFAHIEVVCEKTPEIYRSVLDKHQIVPQHFLMVGNSLRSDVLPLVELGAHAVHIPYHITWEHENLESGIDRVAGYAELERVSMLPGFVQQLNAQQSD